MKFFILKIILGFIGAIMLGLFIFSFSNLIKLIYFSEENLISYFFDVANVWGVDYSSAIDESNVIRSSTGISLDLLTAVGPLSFSWTAPITQKNTDKTEKFRFNLVTKF